MSLLYHGLSACTGDNPRALLYQGLSACTGDNHELSLSACAGDKP